MVGGRPVAKTMNEDALTRHVARMLVGRDPLEPGEDLDKTLSLCAHHDTLPLLGFQLRRQPGCLEALNEEQRGKIEQAERENILRVTLAVEALKEALSALRPIRPVLFKGLAAAQGWPKTGLRDPGDLDLLVAPVDFLAAKKSLLDNGWSELPTVHGALDDSIASRYGFARVFKHPRRPVTVDLHREPVDRTEPFRVDAAGIRATAVETEVSSGVTVLTPGPPQHFALLALHTVRHGSYRLQGFLDLFFWLSREENRDRDIEIIQYSKENHIFRAVSTAVLVAEELFGTLPGKALMVGRDQSIRRAVLRRRPSVIARSHMVAPGGFRRVAALVDLIDNPFLAAHYLFRLAFPPMEIAGLSSGKGFFAYLRHRVKTFLRLLQSFERLEKDS